MGPFFRIESTTQSKAVAAMQVASKEIWGRTARGGMGPAVKAYAGTLDHRNGIEFSTDIAPHKGGTPLEAKWYVDHTQGVEERLSGEERFACIKATNCWARPAP